MLNISIIFEVECWMLSEKSDTTQVISRIKGVKCENKVNEVFDHDTKSAAIYRHLAPPSVNNIMYGST